MLTGGALREAGGATGWEAVGCLNALSRDSWLNISDSVVLARDEEVDRAGDADGAGAGLGRT